jgi:methanogenic corrinoid protein MtbC1
MMEEKPKILQALISAVSTHDDEMLDKSIDTALESGIADHDIQRSIVQGLDQTRHKIRSNDISIPDFLLCLDTATGGLERLSSMSDSNLVAEDAVPLVIGVVEGDPHTLGKNIIAAIYRACGYQVFDLGVEVSKDSFVREVQQRKARVLALSAMMSTTMAAMPDIIREVKNASPETLVMAGGAPLDENLAKSYGADGYAESAVTVLEETERAMKGFMS